MSVRLIQLSFLWLLLTLVDARVDFLSHRWIAQEDSPVVLRTEKQGAEFHLPFQKLNGWRFYWDIEASFDLSAEDKITLTWVIPRQCSIDQAVIYMASGDGWYRFPSFDPCVQNKIVLAKEQASAEGDAGSWSKIQKIRIAYLPKSKDSTSLTLTEFIANHSWSAEDLGNWGGFVSLAQVEDSIQKLMVQDSEGVFSSSWNSYLASKQKVFNSTERDSPKTKNLVLATRQKAKVLLAELQRPDTNSAKALWVDFNQASSKKFQQRWPDLVKWAIRKNYRTFFIGMPGKGPKKVFEPAIGLLQTASSQGIKLHLWVDQIGMNPCDSQEMESRQLQLKQYSQLFSWEGLQIDNWRFPEADSIRKSRTCRALFAQRRGIAIPSKSDDLLPGFEKQYQTEMSDYLADQLRGFKAAFHAEHHKKPLTLSVYSYPDVARTAVYQDWSKWAKQGLVDEIHTMTMSGDFDEFRRLVEMQKNALPQGFSLRPGLALNSGHNAQDIWTLNRQIRYLQAAGFGGYTLYKFTPENLDSVMRYLP